MRKLFLLAAMATTLIGQGQETHNLKFKVNGLNGDTVYLANYYGDKLYYRDTAVASATGQFTFDRELYAGGIYAVVCPGPKYFEFLLNERSFSMETDTADFNNNMKTKGSEENKLFYGYISFLAEQSKRSAPMKKQLEMLKDGPAKEKVRGQLLGLDEEVSAYQQDLIENNKDLFVASVIQMSLDIDIPEELTADTSKAGLDKAYGYYLAHYWDNVDLSDDKIVRTPVFHRKLKTYFSTTVVQTPDSITAAVDRLLAPLEPSSEVFKYIVHFVTYTFESSDIMGMDAVFVHMGLNYYCPDVNGVSPAWWMDEEKIDKLCERARKLEPLRLGEKAPFLCLPDSTEQHWFNLYELEGPYTVLYFWDPNCGHCKKETPKLLELYHNVLQPKGIEVFSVGKATGDDFEDWKKYIRENELDWLNVGLTKNIFDQAQADASKIVPRYTTLASLNYSETYDIYSTPRVFILDAEKKIRAKGISVEQIGELIERFEQDAAAP